MSFYRRESDDDLIFRVDRWDDGGNRIDCCIAACITLLVGRAAFDEAVRQYPTAYLTLRNRSWVIARRDPRDSSATKKPDSGG